MSKSKLTKEVIERFSITFNKAKNLGITDEDLKYIYEIGPDKFRISIRFNGSRITEVVYGLLNAINRKWEILNSLNNSNQKNDVATTDENEFVNLTLKEGFEKFLLYRESRLNNKNLSQLTYDKDVLAYRSRFIQDSGLLDKKIGEAKDMLIERFDWICSQSPESAKFMWQNDVMKGYIPEEGIRSAMKHGTLAIGQLGLAETLQLLIGKDHTTDEGMDLAKQIEELFNKRCKEYKKEYKLNFGVYYTPAENLCYTAMNKFKAKYGIIENVSDKEYFTNSMHVPVWKKISPFEKIDIESQLTGYSNAGCITYVELPSTTKHNIEALETIVNYAMDKDIPYFAINVPNDTCNNCGYTDEINDVCPMCGSSNISRLRRVTGYLTGNYTTAFNEGKQCEVKDRQKHDGIKVEVE